MEPDVRVCDVWCEGCVVVCVCARARTRVTGSQGKEEPNGLILSPTQMSELTISTRCLTLDKLKSQTAIFQLQNGHNISSFFEGSEKVRTMEPGMQKYIKYVKC